MNIQFTLRHPFSMLVCASSMGGKTHFVLDLIRRRKEIIDTPMDQIIYVYKDWQVRFFEYPEVIFLSDINQVDEHLGQGKNTLVIFDDFMSEFSSTLNKYITTFWTRKIHHTTTSAICLVQAPFAPKLRIVSLNTTYFVFFKMVRDMSCITHIARQLSPHNIDWIVDGYNKAVDKLYGYLFFDLHMKTPDNYRLRDNLFYSESVRIFSS